MRSNYLANRVHAMLPGGPAFDFVGMSKSNEVTRERLARQGVDALGR